MMAGNCFDEEQDAPLHGECAAEIARLNGENAVLRDLLMDALSVIRTIDECELDDAMLLATLEARINAAINGPDDGLLP